MSEETTSKGVRKMILGLIIAEYGLMEVREEVSQDLKSKTNNAINAIKRVQDHFRFHTKATPQEKEIFEKQFVSSEVYMLSELIETVWGFDQDCMEEIIRAIKENVKPAEV